MTCENNRARLSRAVFLSLAPFVSFVAAAQPAATSRLPILIAEDTRAPSARDLAVIRTGARSRDPETAVIAIRALGRLERPALVPDIAPYLKAPLPEIRSEAANALGQAVQRVTSRAPVVDEVQSLLIARLPIEDEPAVRGVLCATIGRLPYGDAQRAEAALIEALAHEESVDARVGIAHGFEALIRLHHAVSPPSADAVTRLQELVRRPAPAGGARMRRLALEALIAAAVPVDDQTIAAALADPDAQVRRLIVRASSNVIEKAVSDPEPMVRIEALRRASCSAAVGAVADTETSVSLAAIDRLQTCHAPEAIAALERLTSDLSSANAPRGWHRAAHAIVALAGADADKARAALPPFATSALTPLRLYAARAAAALADRPTLETLARDKDDNVSEAAIVGLSKTAGHDADRVYVAALSRHGYQVLREAARALAKSGGRSSKGESSADAVAALNAALRALLDEGRDNSHDARVAIAEALASLGARVDAAQAARTGPIVSDLDSEDLHGVASARARITMRGLGSFELALFPSQAPATVVRFVKLAGNGYYNGLTFHRVVPNFVVQGGSPGANEYIGDATYMRDELGMWPHVRGAVGISTRGRDTGDAQIFIDLVDNPRLDHDYTVFGQVVGGMDVVDRILEGDVIERIEIITQ